MCFLTQSDMNVLKPMVEQYESLCESPDPSDMSLLTPLVKLYEFPDLVVRTV